MYIRASSPVDGGGDRGGLTANLNGAVARLVDQRTLSQQFEGTTPSQVPLPCNVDVAVSLGKLFTPVCFCHQAV